MDFAAGDRRHLSHTYGSGVMELPFKTTSKNTEKLRLALDAGIVMSHYMVCNFTL